MPNSQRYHLKNKEIRVLPPEIHAELESQSQDMQKCIRRKSSFKCYSFILIFKYVQSWNEERVNHGTRIGQSWNEDRAIMERGQGQSWNEDRVNHGTRRGSIMERGESQSWNEDRAIMERGQGQSWNEDRVNHGTRIGSIMERGESQSWNEDRVNHGTRKGCGRNEFVGPFSIPDFCRLE